MRNAARQCEQKQPYARLWIPGYSGQWGSVISTPWKGQRLPEILTFLSHGFSLFKKVWKSVDGKVVYVAAGTKPRMWRQSGPS